MIEEKPATMLSYSAPHRCFVYGVDNPGQICAAIAAARPLDDKHVAIPFSLFNLQLARRMGLPAPEIMDLDGYPWPIEPGRKPLRHQKHMSNFMALHPRSFNLSDMGTMKTLATLWALDYLMGQGAITKCLIIAPLSTLNEVWYNEIFRNLLGRRRAVVLYGDREHRRQLLSTDHDFYIINHDGLCIGSRSGRHGFELGALADTIRDRPDINAVVVDECAAYKEWKTRRCKVLSRVVEKKPYLWLLSGTPTPNAPTDAYAQAKLMGTLGDSYTTFRARTMIGVQNGQFTKWAPRVNAKDIVNQVLQPAIRYARAECIDLPPCVSVVRDVALTPTQAAAMATLKKELALTMKNGKRITAVNEAVLRLKLIQISCGAVYGENREIHKTDCSPRIEVLKEVINEAGGKIIVFAPLTSVVNMLHSEMQSALGGNHVAKVYGGTTQAARSEIFRAFQQEAFPRVIVADPGTMAHGLTLTEANTIVWFGPTDKPEVFEQANARINRPGQTRHTLIVKLASTKTERAIFDRLEAKASMQGAILKLAEEGR